MNQEELNESLALLIQDFPPENAAELQKRENITHEMLRDWLAGKIEHLIQKDFHKLLSILYRIDVHENNVKRVFDEYTPVEIPFMLAELMIQRQMQKAKTRIAYRKKQQQNPI